MSISVNNGSEIIVSGPITVHSVKKLKQQQPCEQLDVKETSLDLAGVSEVDTAGLAWVIHLVGQVKRSGKSIHILNPPEQLIKLAEISEVDSLLPI